MTGRRSDDDKGKQGSGYRVGYGKPPLPTQFAKGRSGNPKGRPRGSKNKPVPLQGGAFRDQFLRETQRLLPDREGGGITMIDAVIRRTIVDALKGRPRAQELILRCRATISLADAALETEHLKTMIEAKVYGEQELARRARLGLTNEPELIPHPDDINIDFQIGDVTVRGLQSEKERRNLALMRARVKILREGLAAVKERIASEKSAEQRKLLKQLQAKAQAELDEIENALSF